MSALTAQATSPAERPLAFVVFRDDGPIARALGELARRAGSPPPVALLLIGVVPVLVTALLRGDDASNGLGVAAVAWLVLWGGASSCRLAAPRRRWAVPPLIRLGEYGVLVWIAVLDDETALPGAFAMLAVLAFRHYDLSYRLRYRGDVPPAWLNVLAAGWEGRLLIALLLLVLGTLPAGMYAWAAVLGVATAAECVIGWRRFSRVRRPLEYDDSEDADR